jgi:hypothetical protein
MQKFVFMLGALLGSTSVVGCSAHDTSDVGSTAQTSELGCRRTHPTASGSFVASGNDAPDPFQEPRNPIVAVSASGHTITFTARNGETGTITLSDATASGEFHDASGLAQVWLAPFEGYRPSRPTSTIKLSGGAAETFAIVLGGAEASAMGGGFGFANPFGGHPPYAVAVHAVGDAIEISDPWRATGTITLSGVCAD